MFNGKHLTPAQRSLLASAASHRAWAKVQDRTDRTARARQGFNARFEKLVDPDGKLPPDERAKRAESLRRAHFKEMAARSLASRRAKREAMLGAPLTA